MSICKQISMYEILFKFDFYSRDHKVLSNKPIGPNQMLVVNK